LTCPPLSFQWLPTLSAPPSLPPRPARVSPKGSIWAKRACSTRIQVSRTVTSPPRSASPSSRLSTSAPARSAPPPTNSMPLLVSWE
ncbi:unnamed protein product, partial [Mycena citricolor]